MSNDSSQPGLHQHGRQVQRFGTVRQFPLGLSYEARRDSCPLVRISESDAAAS
jgi:starvation-inducible DNA-binding protein